MVDIIRVVLPNSNIERPTARNVKVNLVGFLMLDLIVKPAVAGRLEVIFCILLEEILISCSPLSTSRG